MEAALIAGTALSAGGSFMKGREQSMAADFERQQLDVAAQQSRTAAAQTEARRREELNAQIGTLSTIWAGRGVGADSPTSRAIEDAVIAGKESQIMTERTNLLTKADQARMGSSFAARRSEMAAIAGVLGAGEKIAGGMFKYSRL